MTRREVVIEALNFRPPPYIPWSWGMTQECAVRVDAAMGEGAAARIRFGNHFCGHGSGIGSFTKVGDDHVRDRFGSVWDRSIDKDIGVVVDWPIRRPEDLAAYTWPDVAALPWWGGIPATLAAHPDRFQVYSLGFSLYERAWAMRGMTELLMDMVDRPEFVEDLMDGIVECNLGEIRKALTFGVDAVHFGDDYGSQGGLIMGIEHWRHFIKPRLARMFAPVREAGRFVTMHSCGCVASLFDELVGIGLNCFNPFQPEVMDVYAIKRKYHGRLAFHGGMSVQKTLPFGTPDDVRAETRRLLDAGRVGGYIFSPSHAVPPDVPPANLLAMAEVLWSQPGAPRP